MLKHISRAHVIGTWLVAVTVAIVGAVAGGVAINTGNIALWLVAGLVPPVVMLRLWPEAPAATVADVLYAPPSAKSGRR